MEELQSTEILDREILEDARKKAQRILKTADETIAAQTLEWEQRATSALEDRRLKYARQKDEALREIASRLPTGKRGIRAEAVDRLLEQAVENWYGGLDQNRVRGILTTELKQRLDESGEFRVTDAESKQPPCRAFFHGLSRADAEGIIHSLLPAREFVFEESGARGAFAELVIENSAVRIVSSAGRAVDFFLRRNRAELAEALLGAAFFDGEGEMPC